MRTSFSRCLRALAPLPVQLALTPALGLKKAQESPPPVDPCPAECPRARPPLGLTREHPEVDVTLSLTLPRPRGRMSMEGET